MSSTPSSSAPTLPLSNHIAWVDRLKSMTQAQLLQVVLNLASHSTESEVFDAINSIREEDPALKDNSTRKVFVRQISFDTTTETLRTCFEPFGEIEEAAVVFDKISGKSKGYGFVTFTTPEAATRALVEPIKTIDGRNTESCLASVGKEDMVRRKQTTSAGDESPRQRKQNTPAKPKKAGKSDDNVPGTADPAHAVPPHNYAQHIMMMHDSPRVRGRVDHYGVVQGGASGPSSTSTSAVSSPRPYAPPHHAQYGHFESSTSSLNSSRSSTPTPAGQHAFVHQTSPAQQMHSKGLAASHVQNYAYSPSQQSYPNPFLQGQSHAAPMMASHHPHSSQHPQSQPHQQHSQPQSMGSAPSQSYSPSFYGSPRQTQMSAQPSEIEALRLLSSHPDLSALLAQIALTDDKQSVSSQPRGQAQYAQHAPMSHGQYQDAPLPLSPTVHGKFSYDFPPSHQQ